MTVFSPEIKRESYIELITYNSHNPSEIPWQRHVTYGYYHISKTSTPNTIHITNLKCSNQLVQNFEFIQF